MREYVVTQSQTLIQATYAMTVWEQRLLLSCISQIDSRLPMPEDNAYTLTVEQARDLFYTDANAQNVYRDMARAVEKLYERDVKIQLPDNETLQTRFISSVLWSPDKYQITLKFAPDIRPYLSQLQNNFAGYKLKNIVQLTSSYAIRLYEKLVGWAVRDMYYQEMEVAAFREMLALGDKYERISQLKERVIEPAVQQINANTDFSLDVSFKKCKREVRWIQLRFNQKAEAAAAAAEARKQRDARALQNQAAKANRAIQEQKQAAAAAVQTALSEWQSLPDGSIFAHQDGSVWRKDGSTLYSKEKNARIVEAQIPHLLASGQLAHLPPHPPAPPLPTEEESEA
ncbi:replication initiation protein, partial [Neisseria meningitidis]